MKRLFVDTGAFVAKEVAGDQYHATASRCWGQLSDRPHQLVSSEHVLDESATLLAHRATYAFASGWGADALGSGIRWLKAGEPEWRAAFLLMRKFADQGVSFTDCLSFALMKREGIKQAFGFDRHFEAAGFRLWPGQS